MDFATIIGVIICGGLLGFSVMENFRLYIHQEAIMIVFGGTLGVICVGVTWQKLLGLVAVVKNAFYSRSVSPLRIIDKIVKFSEIARRDGILALEGVIDEVDDRFLVKGLQMAVDGSDPEVIQEALSTEMECSQGRHVEGQQIFNNMAKYGPAFGLIGTLIGLVAMLGNMEDPDQIAPNMAVALIATLYGCTVANVIAQPIVDKLIVRNKEELLLKQIIIQGVISIQSGDNPKVVEQKLKLFLPPKMRGE
jgi:chemotaxis protein MotA